MSDVPLLLVDGHNLLWRAWFGFPARIRSRDKTRDVTGVFGFFALLRVALRELPALPAIVVAFDGENAWARRTAIDHAYKAHRPTDEAAMAPIRALDDVMRGSKSLGITQLCVDTDEADDLIATVHRRTHGRDVWIMSTDRDFYQLLDHRTRILNTARKPGHRVIECTEISVRFGVTPGQWCDRISLVGDPSDGIRGIRGVGTVTAARLLAGGLRVEELPRSGRLVGRVGDRINESFDHVLQWKYLAEMATDCAVTDDLVMSTPTAALPPAPIVLDLLDLW